MAIEMMTLYSYLCFSASVMYQSKIAVSGKTLHKYTERSLPLPWGGEGVDLADRSQFITDERRVFLTLECECSEEEQELEPVPHLSGS